VLAVAAGCRVTAVHVDHGLRPGSAGEAEVVAEAARRFGASFRSERVALTEGSNLEARARDARRRVLGPDAATGHTADDQAETVLANLLRGSGVSGLAAMRAGPVHPLLDLRRAETAALCRHLGLAPVRDPSNDDPRFLRNRIRGQLLPLCSEVAGRDVVPILARQAGVLAGDAEVLEAVASLVDPADAAALATAPTAVARRAVRTWLTGGGDHPPPLDAVERVLEVARKERRAAEVPGSRRVARSNGRLSVSPVKPPPCRRSAPLRYSLAVATGEHEAPGDRPSLEAGADVGRVIVSEGDLQDRIAELGAQITLDYLGRPPLLVGVLKGAFMFMSDLSRAVSLPAEVDFMAVSSYGSATRSSGVVRIVKDLDADLADRHVLVVEDIVDSGLTLSYLQRYLLARGPASLEVCALLVKDGQQRTELDLRYVGFHIPAEFVVGYGLDVNERLRNLRAVHAYAGDST
jgi:hypoxanthine phosphoribosyltransferase